MAAPLLFLLQSSGEQIHHHQRYIHCRKDNNYSIRNNDADDHVNCNNNKNNIDYNLYKGIYVSHHQLNVFIYRFINHIKYLQKGAQSASPDTAETFNHSAPPTVDTTAYHMESINLCINTLSIHQLWSSYAYSISSRPSLYNSICIKSYVKSLVGTLSLHVELLALHSHHCLSPQILLLEKRTNIAIKPTLPCSIELILICNKRKYVLWSNITVRNILNMQKHIKLLVYHRFGRSSDICNLFKCSLSGSSLITTYNIYHCYIVHRTRYYLFIDTLSSHDSFASFAAVTASIAITATYILQIIIKDILFTETEATAVTKASATSSAGRGRQPL